MKVHIDNIEYKFNTPKKVIDVIKNDDKTVLACIVNNRLKDLNFVLEDGLDISLVKLNSVDGMWVYQSTLRYIICMAVHNVLKNAKLRISYSVSRSLYASISGLDHLFSIRDFNKVKNEVDRLIKEDLPITFTQMPKKEAMKKFESMGYYDKVSVLKQRKKDYFYVYKCGEYINNMYEFLMPSTGYIKNYKLTIFGGGFNIFYPRTELDEKLPKFVEEQAFREVLRDSAKWASIIRANSVSELRTIIENKSHLDLINLCETRHTRELTNLGNKIESNIDKIKLICVAGPSSSGKTTFTNRLRIELKSRGIEPLMISMDNFYKTKNYPKDKNGLDDYEHIKALDLNLFDKTIYSLIQGEQVRLPKFIFGVKTREWGEPIRLKKNQPILIEGIHGLNNLIAPSVSSENKFRIFISPITTIRIDDHSPISSTDLRLVRRIVRDAATRKTNCTDTIKQWSSVRAGEFKWIYPYQDNADFVYNSELAYELCVTAKLAIPLLKTVERSSKEYNVARRITKILNYIPQMDDKWIPCNSILREFIGESIFYPNDKRK